MTQFNFGYGTDDGLKEIKGAGWEAGDNLHAIAEGLGNIVGVKPILRGEVSLGDNANLTITVPEIDMGKAILVTSAKFGPGQATSSIGGKVISSTELYFDSVNTNGGIYGVSTVYWQLIELK